MRKGYFRMVGTVVGAVAAVILSGLFPQQRLWFLLGLAVWGGACGFVSRMLLNFASYAAALAGYTAVIIAAGELGTTGGLNGDGFMIAVARAMERLNDEQREAVVLKIYEGFKFEEMAEVLGCPVSTVKSRLYTALDLLKDTLAPATVTKAAREQSS